MSTHSLIWAAVPHNSDGVVFQIRIVHGLQRFHVSRRALEAVFDLEPRASDAKQLQHFYSHLTRILARAGEKRSFCGSDTVPLQAADFTSTSSRETFASSRHAMA
ncbi:hypothetical protein PQR64_04540 [Paraburkholderia phytofirmans]|uniref:hypothetical protein n=1 Tax=Paraburkholderia phytofirmans TaxID=261302 RepID=UPI0038B6EE2E